MCLQGSWATWRISWAFKWQRNKCLRQMRSLWNNCRYEKQGREEITLPHCWSCLCSCGRVSKCSSLSVTFAAKHCLFFGCFFSDSVFCGKDSPFIKGIFFWFCLGFVLGRNKWSRAISGAHWGKYTAAAVQNHGAQKPVRGRWKRCQEGIK